MRVLPRAPALGLLCWNLAWAAFELVPESQIAVGTGTSTRPSSLAWHLTQFSMSEEVFDLAFPHERPVQDSGPAAEIEHVGAW